MAEVTFDYQNLIEVEGGLQSGELDEIGPRLREAADGLLGDPPGFMRLPKTGEVHGCTSLRTPILRRSPRSSTSPMPKEPGSTSSPSQGRRRRRWRTSS